MLFSSRRDRLLAIAHQILIQYRRNLHQLEARCLRSLLQGLGSVAIASVLLAPGAARAVESASLIDYPVEAQADRPADQAALSFDLTLALTEDGVGTGGGRRDDDGPEPHPTAVVASLPGRVISTADSSRSSDPKPTHEKPTHAKQFAKNIAISLQLPEPAIVASAPLSLSNALSNSAQRWGQALTSPQASAPRTGTVNPAKPIPEAWWHQGEKSPIAVAIGAAEGTRDVNGDKTDAYYWHSDPGNGADNFGTFSYQHLPHSLTQAVRQQTTTAAKREVSAQEQLPEISDRAQIQRLRKFHDQLQQQAAARGIVMNQLELLNGLDLANQSEAAALWPEGYVDRLAQLKTLTDDAELQILEARAWSYWNPERKAWDAPGLGNTYANVLQDQRRRYESIRDALEQYSPATGASATTPQEVAANQIISFIL